MRRATLPVSTAAMPATATHGEVLGGGGVLMEGATLMSIKPRDAMDPEAHITGACVLTSDGMAALCHVVPSARKGLRDVGAVLIGQEQNKGHRVIVEALGRRDPLRPVEAVGGGREAVQVFRREEQTGAKHLCRGGGV